ncbi:hypothetical protein KP509_27G007200 [Ceratopteris richardii]|uniref:ADF-H domain-containing protein n=1 Tax=Ceratopteris richardii TaxID=49495 RepID=A0A8T2RG70_CERRI|nr:hypothetical protein KP509_27G007200 [Ceratopteris richardii]
MANAASGMVVEDECKLKFLELKSKRTHCFSLYKIDDKLNKIVVDKLGGPDENFNAFTSSFPEKD